MKLNKKNVIYANRINLTGLFYHEPIECIYDEKGEFYYSNKFDFVIDQSGEVIRDGSIDFASKNRSEVGHWTKGALAALKMLQKWSTAHNGEV